MTVKKKKKPDLVLVGALVPKQVAGALKAMAADQDRTVSKIVKKLIEESPDVQRALKEQAA